MIRRRSSVVTALAAACAGVWAASLAVAYPEPSKVPVSWELTLKADPPQRIVVGVPGQPNARAYWYVTYTVINDSDQDVNFLPRFEWVTSAGKVVRSDRNIPAAVFEKIKEKTKNTLLEPALKIAGTLRQGEDQAKDGVAIWEEPEPRLGAFQIFVTGLSGESTQLTGPDGQPVLTADGKPTLLYKTLQMDFRSAGDEVYPGNDLLVKTGQSWVMR